MLRRILFTTAALLMLTAAFLTYRYYSAHADRTVSGKVLIVLNNAEVLKLGLVDIHVLPSSEAERWVGQLSPIVGKAIKEADGDYDRIAGKLRAGRDKSESYVVTSLKLKSIGEAALRVRKLQSGGSLMRNETTSAAAQRGVDEIKSGYSKLAYWFRDDINAMLKEQRFKEIAVSTAEALGRLQDEAKAFGRDTELDAASLSRDASEMLRGVERAKAGLFTPPDGFKRAARAITDGDGQFTLKLPPGDYVLFATSKRQLSSNQGESYFWAVRLTVNLDQDNSIILGNQNLESNSSDSLWPRALTGSFVSLITGLKSVGQNAELTAKTVKSNARSIGVDQQSIIVGLSSYR